MSEAGYTLAETLAAMAVISLAMGGLSLGVQVIAPSQAASGKAAARLEGRRAAQLRLEGLLARGAPFPSSDPEALTGDEQALSFACAAPGPCRAELSEDDAGRRFKLFDGRSPAPAISLPVPDDARLAYRGVWTSAAQWPPQTGRAEPLRSVALLAGRDGAAPALIEARIWREQTADCAFDPVSGACR